LIHKFNPDGGPAKFFCDEKGCGETFLAKSWNIKAAWEEAMQFGWRLHQGHDPISFMKHYCPSHSRMKVIT